MQKTIVIEAKEAPSMKNPVIVSGIRDRAAALAWGERNGHALVYFIARKQRVYAERLMVRVDTLAQKIEKQSTQLVAFAEER